MRSEAASVVRARATPCPSIAASITMLARLRTGPCKTSASGTPAASEPPAPVAPVVEMQQGQPQEVGRLAQAIAAGHQLRAADRKELLRTEPHHVEPRP